MVKEKERRWRVESYSPKILVGKRKDRIVQGYVSSDPESMRVRIVNGKKAFFTFKKGSGIERDEDEKPNVNIQDAKFALKGCKYSLSKTRYHCGKWELDIFEGVLKGIVLVEYESPDCEKVVKPDWFEGFEVTDTLTNRQLARFAYDIGCLTQHPLTQDDKLFVKKLFRKAS